MTSIDAEMLYVRFALDEECAVETEGMWAERTSAGELVLRSIPVFTPGVAFGDAISIEEANDCLWAVDVVREGDQATLWIQSDLANPSRALEALEQIAEHLESMGAMTELFEDPMRLAASFGEEVSSLAVEDYLWRSKERLRLEYAVSKVPTWWSTRGYG